jgi:hypothetical protein
LLEHPDEGKRSASVAVEKHEMWEILVAHGIDFVYMFVVVDGNVAKFELLVEIQF